MLDNEPTGGASALTDTTTEQSATAPAVEPPKRRTRRATRPAGSPAPTSTDQSDAGASEAAIARSTDEAAAKPARARRTRKTAQEAAPAAAARGGKKTTRSRGAKSAAGSAPPAAESAALSSTPTVVTQPPSLIFQEPITDGDAPVGQLRTRKRAESTEEAPAPVERGAAPVGAAPVGTAGVGADTDADDTAKPRRRRRGGRTRRQDSGETTEAAAGEAAEETEAAAGADAQAAAGAGEGDQATTISRRRRRRRRRAGASEVIDESAPDDPERTVVKVREPRNGDEAEPVQGSTRLEAKKQRRRESRESGRRRVPLITEAEFLARRESVERVMVVRELDSRIQIAVLEDGILVEHYVSREAQSSLVGNVYLGRVQNVLPSMEAAFVDIGRGRNAVLYAGEVNFDVAGLEGQPKRIENALKSGQSVLVQVTKDPIAHKGARLTSQISLPGRFLVYVPEGSMTGISRKLPETERSRLKALLRSIIPDDAGFIVRTAAEGASEAELERDVKRLIAQWEDIKKKSATADAPALLYGEPDLTIRVIRDIFNEDFTRLVVSGASAWDTVEPYVQHVAPDLVARMSRWTDDEDVFAAYRIDEQLAKALDRKVWLPSGGSLVIDRTEAMTVIDVNTGRFTGQGGNLEETVTKNNLEAAEEIVRQLRLRDIGGIIVVDFIDMVLESNRELVLRRLLECLGRDRTKHQVAEVTSLGLVQMTRKRVGQGLLEAFSETCECCGGRGIKIHAELLEPHQNDGHRQGRGIAVAAGGVDARTPVAPATVDASVAAEAPSDEAPGQAAEPEPAPAPRRRRRATRRQGSPASAANRPPAPALAHSRSTTSGIGAVPSPEPTSSHPAARRAPLGWPA